MSISVDNISKLPTQELTAYVQRAEDRIARGELPPDIDRMEVELADSGEVNIRYYRLNPRRFERIRRITGYLVGTTDRWNDAKKAELHDRVQHGLEATDETL